jgi:hypothetical protein
VDLYTRIVILPLLQRNQEFSNVFKRKRQEWEWIFNWIKSQQQNSWDGGMGGHGTHLYGGKRSAEDSEEEEEEEEEEDFRGTVVVRASPWLA